MRKLTFNVTSGTATLCRFADKINLNIKLNNIIDVKEQDNV